MAKTLEGPHGTGAYYIELEANVQGILGALKGKIDSFRTKSQVDICTPKFSASGKSLIVTAYFEDEGQVGTFYDILEKHLGRGKLDVVEEQHGDLETLVNSWSPVASSGAQSVSGEELAEYKTKLDAAKKREANLLADLNERRNKVAELEEQLEASAEHEASCGSIFDKDLTPLEGFLEALAAHYTNLEDARFDAELLDKVAAWRLIAEKTFEEYVKSELGERYEGSELPEIMKKDSSRASLEAYAREREAKLRDLSKQHGDAGTIITNYETKLKEVTEKYDILRNSLVNVIFEFEDQPEVKAPLEAKLAQNDASREEELKKLQKEYVESKDIIEEYDGLKELIEGDVETVNKVMELQEIYTEAKERLDEIDGAEGVKEVYVAVTSTPGGLIVCSPKPSGSLLKYIHDGIHSSLKDKGFTYEEKSNGAKYPISFLKINDVDENSSYAITRALEERFMDLGSQYKARITYVEMS